MVCNNTLAKNEHNICVNCLAELPRIAPYVKNNNIEKQFIGTLPIEKGTAYIEYRKYSPYNNIIHNIKYNNRPEAGKELAINAAVYLLKSNFFDEMDVIIPLPLSKKKKRQRGYNQCDYIAQGLSQVTGIAIDKKSVIRHKANDTQTNKTREERWKNVQNIFKVTDKESLSGKHILLVDDVITTGATLTSCGKEILSAAPNAKISIFALACATNAI